MSAVFVVDDIEHERFRAEVASLTAVGMPAFVLPELRPMEEDVHHLRRRGLHIRRQP